MVGYLLVQLERSLEIVHRIVGRAFFAEVQHGDHLPAVAAELVDLLGEILVVSQCGSVVWEGEMLPLLGGSNWLDFRFVLSPEV